MSDPAPPDSAALSARAAAIVAWVGGRSAAAVDAALADRRHPFYAVAEELADAADAADDRLRSAGLAALFSGLVEPLNDGFSPAGRAAYARLFTAVVWRAAQRQPALQAALRAEQLTTESLLFDRYAMIRGDRGPLADAPRRIAVLSRVTIGADILLTSLAIQAVARRWPGAEIALIGDGKLAGLFGGGGRSAGTAAGTADAAFPAVQVVPLTYRRRGGLGDRLAAWLALREALALVQPEVLVNPDSRLDQLGILPSAAAQRTLLWENLLPGPAESLADRCAKDFAARLQLPAIAGLRPRLALDQATQAAATRWRDLLAGGPWLAVKLDHGGNPAKALPRAGEIDVLRAARSAGWRILIDRGFGPDELAGSDRLLHELGWTALDVDDSGDPAKGAAIAGLTSVGAAPVVRFHGSIAGWAAALTACRQAFSYDSVGHHLAAALGVPVVVAFTGHSDPAFPVAWQPRGPGTVALVVIPTAEKQSSERIAEVIAAIGRPA